jgi:DNA-binding beta-propeller fold protein YncE
VLWTKSGARAESPEGTRLGYLLIGSRPLADSIYWSDPYDNTIRGAPLAGSGSVDTIFSAAPTVSDAPWGLAIDAAAGRIYWTSRFGNKIQRAPLAPGGTAETLYGQTDGVNDPTGIAIHPAAGRIYWSNSGDATIRRAPLAPHGNVETLYSGSAEGVVGPAGVAIDPAEGRIYWANAGDNTIRVAPLAPHGNVQPLYGPQGLSNPWWVAIDPAAGRIYWTFWSWYTDARIQDAPLAGGGNIDNLYDSTRGVTSPGGLAIDPSPAPGLKRLEIVRDTESFARWFGRARDWASDLFFRSTASPGLIYWGNGQTGGRLVPQNPGTIQRAPLAPGGAFETLYRDYAQVVGAPYGLALLRAPLGTVPPTITWQFVLSEGPVRGPLGPAPNSDLIEHRLACSPGTWAPDLLGSFLYRAPQSITYQWMRNGTDLTGYPDPTKPYYTPTSVGNYSCRVTATNRAGSAAQTSAASAVSSGMLPSP